MYISSDQGMYQGHQLDEMHDVTAKSEAEMGQHPGSPGALQQI